MAFTKFGLATSSGETPAASDSSSVKKRMHSRPAAKLSQNSSTLFAPGKRTDMPTMAISIPLEALLSVMVPFS